MKKIIALLITITLVSTFGIGAIAGATADDFQATVVQETTNLLLERAAVEASLGNDAEAAVYQEMADNNFGRTKLGFNKLLAAITVPTYGWSLNCTWNWGPKNPTQSVDS